MYFKKIELFLLSLNEQEKDTANRIINDYLRQGKTARFVCLAFAQLKGRSVEKYRYLMFNQKFLQQIWKQYLWSVADDLDGVIFNGLASEDDLRAIARWIDIEAYKQAERGFCDIDKGNHDKYRYDVIKYLFNFLEKMNEVDVNTIENIINPYIEEEEKWWKNQK